RLLRQSSGGHRLSLRRVGTAERLDLIRALGIAEMGGASGESVGSSGSILSSIDFASRPLLEPHNVSIVWRLDGGGWDSGRNPALSLLNRRHRARIDPVVHFGMAVGKGHSGSSMMVAGR